MVVGRTDLTGNDAGSLPGAELNLRDEMKSRSMSHSATQVKLTNKK